MSGVHTLTPRSFLDRFFGQGNQLSLANPRQQAALQPWTQRVLELKGRVLLPRQSGGVLVWYALARTARDARAFREELIAAVGPSYSDFIGVGASLRPSDPVEAAVLDFSGRHAFKLSVVDPENKDACRTALQRMLDLHDQRPPSRIRCPRVPGLILRDLELALQQMDREAADAAIDEMRAGGFLDGQNLRFLEIRRLEVFGEWPAVLEELESGTVVDLRRPARITQALLRAFYRTELQGFDDSMRASEALAHFKDDARNRLGPLLETREGMSAPEVAKLFMLKAAATHDAGLRDSLLQSSMLRGADKVYLQALADLVEPKAPASSSRDDAQEAYLDGHKDRAFELLLGGGGGGRRIGLLLRCALDLGTFRVAELALEAVDSLTATEREAIAADPRLQRQVEELNERYAAPSRGVPTGWLDWFGMVSDGALEGNRAAELAQQGADEWSLEQLAQRPADVALLADAIQDLTGTGKQQLRFALPHLHRFVFSEGTPPAGLKPLLRSMLELYVLDEARSAGIWGATTEAFEALLRCGLSDAEYSDAVELLEMLLDEGLPLERVELLLDLLESLVLLAPGRSPTVRAAVRVQTGLQRWCERLSPAKVELFNQLGRELGTEVTLPLPTVEADDESVSGLNRLVDKVVAMYSLNERALARVKTILEKTVKGVRVLAFHDKVGGGKALRGAARTADVFLVVTGAAKHAATEFIEANRRKDLVTIRTHGKGSASMLRELETGI